MSMQGGLVIVDAQYGVLEAIVAETRAADAAERPVRTASLATESSEPQEAGAGTEGGQEPAEGAQEGAAGPSSSRAGTAEASPSTAQVPSTYALCSPCLCIVPMYAILQSTCARPRLVGSGRG